MSTDNPTDIQNKAPKDKKGPKKPSSVDQQTADQNELDGEVCVDASDSSTESPAEQPISLTDLEVGEPIERERDPLQAASAEITKDVNYQLEDFLSEKDPYRALLIWLIHIEPLEQRMPGEAIKHWLLREIAYIDELINEQLNLILHHEKLQKLEASWRGLAMLCKSAAEFNNTWVKFLDISWAEVSKDIGRSMEFDQSHLFHKIYSTEFGMPGGKPYGVIIGDYEISHRPSKNHPYDDISTLTVLAQVAAASFAPYITAASAEFFGLDNLQEMNGTIQFEKIFQQEEYIKWRAFRDQEDSRFVGLTLPRVLMRSPYTARTTGFHGLNYKEVIDSNDDYCWGNASYAFATVLIREFGNVGWFSHIRGVPRDYLGGGLVSELNPYHFKTDKEGIAIKPLSNVVITDHLERRLSELGLIPACQCYDTPFLAFHSNQSTQKPKIYDDKEATINAKLSGMLQHILCASRFAHFIKVMIRDKTGSFMTADQVQKYIERWLHTYTSGSDSGGWDIQARYPLRDSEVIVRERLDKPGSYSSVIHLKPHYQLDQMVSELKLTTELAPMGSRG